MRAELLKFTKQLRQMVAKKDKTESNPETIAAESKTLVEETIEPLVIRARERIKQAAKKNWARANQAHIEAFVLEQAGWVYPVLIANAVRKTISAEVAGPEPAQEPSGLA
jgi:hypothetical protein